MKKRRWIIKAGSNAIIEGGPMLIASWMKQVAGLKSQGIEVVWVTSGAIASASERINFNSSKRTLPEKQALSALGQPMVMNLYNQALNFYGSMGAQVLLTYDDLNHMERVRNFKNTIEQLLKWGITPILNENDAVATEEIRFGDNDYLSAKVAVTLKANRLVILTDIEGLYDSDPRRNPQAQRIQSLHSIGAKEFNQAGGKPQSGSKRGTGGMYSKLKAAQLALDSKISTILAKGDRPHVLQEISQDLEVGTWITPDLKKKRRI
jgi:glutamate 5-kinase